MTCGLAESHGVGCPMDGECHDRDHVGLREYVSGTRITDRIEAVPFDGGPLPWMGQDVAMLAHRVREEIERARALEREACALIVESYSGCEDPAIAAAAEEIRARGAR